ncbi:methyltransferase [Nocardia arthritidis]|nr:methyltransferase [Nocardia arthritidis]
MSENVVPPLPPAVVIHEMAYGLGAAAAVQAAANLGIADLIGDEPVGVAELAGKIGADADAMARLLRALTVHGVFRETTASTYAHTELSLLLRDDAEGSRRDMVRLAGAPWAWRLWPKLAEAVRTGTGMFEPTYGKNLWAHLAEDPSEFTLLFDRAMTAGNSLTAGPVADALDLTGVGLVADIGGGQGKLLRTVLRRHPDVAGVLFDLPSAIAEVDPELTGAGELAGRCRVVPGDCLREIPIAADVYLLKHVLHMWDDDTAVAVLRNVVTAARPGSRVVIVEQLLDRSPAARVAATIDLLMLLLTGGKERGEADFRELLDRAGLRFDGVTATGTILHLVTGTVRDA